MQIATAEVRQRTNNTIGERKPSRSGDLSLGLHNQNWGGERQHMALQRLAKDWSSYDLTIYSDGSATNGTEIGGGGILVTADHPSNPTIHHSYAIPAHCARHFKPKWRQSKRHCRLPRQKSHPRKSEWSATANQSTSVSQTSNQQYPLRALTRVTS